MRIIVNGGGKILMYGIAPAPPLGCTAFDLTPAQDADYAAASAQPNCGVTFNAGVFTPIPPPAPPDLSDYTALSKNEKALLLVSAAWAGKTPAEAKTAFKTAWQALP